MSGHGGVVRKIGDPIPAGVVAVGSDIPGAWFKIGPSKLPLPSKYRDSIVALVPRQGPLTRSGIQSPVAIAHGSSPVRNKVSLEPSAKSYVAGLGRSP